MPYRAGALLEGADASVGFFMPYRAGALLEGADASVGVFVCATASLL